MRKQAGMTFIGIMLLAAVGGFLAYAGLRVAPMYIEFYTIENTLQSVVDEAKVEKLSPLEMRTRFDKVLDVNSITIVTARDLDIQPGPAGTTLSVSYSKCAPLVHRLKICGDFEATRSYQPE